MAAVIGRRQANDRFWRLADAAQGKSVLSESVTCLR
uniref:Uncharacterized protein n=1 Tax=Siphoviridae sp. ct2u94 TaxID=2826277 RepID=A0A8S5QWN2_9CAUD|nr:MAG TPA: hypothetical protein [Siphoviridae sp. ct2u94]